MIIHIGYEKVLSTFLQKEIFDKISVKVITDESLSGNTLNWRSGVLSRYSITIGLSIMYPDAKIILCIRKDREAWIKSIYSQYIKEGGFKSFDKWIDQNFDFGFLDYDKHIKLLQTLFVNTHILYYEDFINDKQKEIKRLCNFIGVQVPNKINFDRYYNKRWYGIKLKIGILRGILFKISRIILEMD